MADEAPPGSPPRAPASSRRRTAARLACALVLAIASVQHAVLAFGGAPGAGRHAVFVGINAAVALLVARWPRAALAPVLVLTLQQLVSHGADLVRSIRGPGPLDVASLGVVVFFPALTLLLAAERRRGTPARPRRGRAAP
ncbi:MAG: hypothetical protein KC657_13145 [Myxococcales bacterium]|nr:hypothetical protein [Myxococcales bacterium]